MDFKRAWMRAWPPAFFVAVALAIFFSFVRCATPHDQPHWVLSGTGLLCFGAFVCSLNIRHKRAAGRSPTETNGDGRPRTGPARLYLRHFAGVRTESIESVPAFIRMIVDPAHHRTRTVETISLKERLIEQRVWLELTVPPPSRADAGAPGGAGSRAPAPEHGDGRRSAEPDAPEAAAAPPPGGTDGNRPAQAKGGAAHDAAPAPAEVHVPVLLVRKGEPVDHLEIRDAQGQPLNTLCHEETMQLISVAVHFLVASCVVGPTGDGDMPSSSVPEEAVVVAKLHLLDLIHGTDPMSEAGLDEQIDDALKLIEPPGTSEVNPRVTWLREFVKALSRAYPVIAVLPAGKDPGRIGLSYRRTVVPSLDSKSLRARLRFALGLRPFKVGVDTALAQKSRSYHLHVDGPATRYLMEQTLRCRICGGDLTPSGVKRPPGGWRDGHDHPRYATADPVHVELRGKRGQPFAHLYMRGFARVKSENLVLSAAFGETPPGTLASATITSALACLLIGAVGHAEAMGTTAGSDIPALVLALPTAAASWFGFSSDGEAVLSSSLAARCSLLVAGVASFLGSIVFLVTKRGAVRPHAATGPTIFGMHMPSWWAVLFLVTVLNLLYVVTQLALRSWSYRRLHLRKESDGIHTGAHTLE